MIELFRADKGGRKEMSDQIITEISAEAVEEHVNVLYEYLQGQIPSIIGFGIRVVLAVVVFLVGRKLLKWILKILRRWLVKANAAEGVVQFVCSVSRIGLYLLLIFNIAISLGVKESSVAALLGTAGVTVGLALQGGLANVAGGIMILIFKPFQVGDYIIQDAANGSEGTVSRIDIYYTTLISPDNKQIVIPNGNLANSTILNVTAGNQRKLILKINISYEADLEKAMEIIRKLLDEDPDVIREKETDVHVDELLDSSVCLGVFLWVSTDRYWQCKWNMNRRIKEAFDENGIQIPYPQLDVHVVSRDGIS